MAASERNHPENKDDQLTVDDLKKTMDKAEAGAARAVRKVLEVSWCTGVL